MTPKKIDVRKSRTLKARKTRAAYDALKRLNSYLDSHNPRTVRFLTRLWDDQEAAVTYQELRESILNGSMSEDLLEAWQHDYQKFFRDYLYDELFNACEAGSLEVARAMKGAKAADQIIAPMAQSMRSFVSQQGADLVTLMTQEGKESINALIEYCVSGNKTIDETARLIRPLVGLTRPQSIANVNYHDAIKEQLLKDHPKMTEASAEKKAHEAALKYAARQHRERAQMIAETETGFAYNKGADDAVKEMVNAGLMPQMEAVWSTADDELVCPICGGLEGTRIPLGGAFPWTGAGNDNRKPIARQIPPAHPRCRCALMYEEVGQK
jgi:hypothetical protein